LAEAQAVVAERDRLVRDLHASNNTLTKIFSRPSSAWLLRRRMQ
jgi:hypothetical protein